MHSLLVKTWKDAVSVTHALAEAEQPTTSLHPNCDQISILPCNEMDPFSEALEALVGQPVARRPP